MCFGSYLITSKSFLESFYLCFSTLFTIHLHRKTLTNNYLFLHFIYLFIGLAIVLLYIKAIKKQIEMFLINFGRRILRNFIELTQQMGRESFRNDMIT